MTYRVQFSKEIQRQIGRLPGNVRTQAKQRILSLAPSRVRLLLES